MDGHRIVKFSGRFGPRSISLVTTYCPHEWAWSRSRDVLPFWQVLISRQRCKIEMYLQWKTNRKSYMAYQIAATAVTFSDIQGHSQVGCVFKCKPSNIYAAFTRIQLTVCSRSLYVSWTSRMNRETTDKKLVYARNNSRLWTSMFHSGATWHFGGLDASPCLAPPVMKSEPQLAGQEANIMQQETPSSALKI